MTRRTSRFGYVPGYHTGTYHRLQRRLFGSRRFSRELEYRLIAPWFAGPPLRVLDLACGGGDFTWALALSGHRVTGMDRDLEALQTTAPVRPHVAGTDFVGGDALHLPFRAGAFDACMCNSSIEHFDDPGSALRELARTLKPGGLLVLTTDAFPEALSSLWRHVPRRWLKSHLREGDVAQKAREHHRREHHVATYFTIGHMRGLLESAGFEVEDVRNYLGGPLPKAVFEAHIVLGGLEFYNTTSRRLYPLLAPLTRLDSKTRPGFGVFAAARKR
jgi:ubiquinone/menaquinone biosynthesis C-methylase UbiE